MLKNYINGVVIALIFIGNSVQAHDKEICITIDDLPFVGSNGRPGDLKREQDRFSKIVQTLVDEKVPATGFVIGGAIAKGQWQLLENFQKQGFVIGNHTYSHESLNRIGSEKYIKDIAKADERLTPLMTDKKYFRYPYLAEGRGEHKQRVRDYLTSHQYIIAPVTIDSKDFKFNGQFLSINWRNRDNHLDQIKQRYLSYIWKETERAEKLAHGKPVKQILLLHANLLNSHLLGDVIKLYKDHGYRFISLEEALAPVVPKQDLQEAFNRRLLNFFHPLIT